MPATSGHSSEEGRKLQLVMSLQTCASAEDTSHREDFIPNIKLNLLLFQFEIITPCPVTTTIKISLPPFHKPLRHWKAAMRSSRAFSSPGYWAGLLEVAKM